MLNPMNNYRTGTILHIHYPFDAQNIRAFDRHQQIQPTRKQFGIDRFVKSKTIRQNMIIMAINIRLFNDGSLGRIQSLRRTMPHRFVSA